MAPCTRDDYLDGTVGHGTEIAERFDEFCGEYRQPLVIQSTHPGGEHFGQPSGIQKGVVERICRCGKSVLHRHRNRHGACNGRRSYRDTGRLHARYSSPNHQHRKEEMKRRPRATHKETREHARRGSVSSGVCTAKKDAAALTVGRTAGSCKTSAAPYRVRHLPSMLLNGLHLRFDNRHVD